MAVRFRSDGRTPLITGKRGDTSGDKPQRFESVEDGGDLIDALSGLAPATGGEAFGERFDRARRSLLRDGAGGLADGVQELAEGGHLRGQFGRPVGKF